MSVCEKLRQKRREHRLKQEEVAQYLGFESRNGYWAIENGKTKLRAEHLILLMQLYGVSSDFFLGEDKIEEKIV